MSHDASGLLGLSIGASLGLSVASSGAHLLSVLLIHGCLWLVRAHSCAECAPNERVVTPASPESCVGASACRVQVADVKDHAPDEFSAWPHRLCSRRMPMLCSRLPASTCDRTPFRVPLRPLSRFLSPPIWAPYPPCADGEEARGGRWQIGAW